MRKGYVQVYTGNGKGKTTAALGLALRAVGAGHRVFIGQFVKAKRCSEHKALARLGNQVTVKLFGKGLILGRAPSAEDIEAARRGLAQAEWAISGGAYELVILDEAAVAASLGLVTVDELLGLIEKKPSHVELVVTGRYADERLLARADLVTEMREVRHYAAQGVTARTGIEK